MADTPRPPGLIQRYREELQARHYAKRTVATYEQWLRRFLRFHGMRHPREMGSEEVNAFLTHLAVERQVSPSTQNQALSALLFLYRELLERDLDLEGVVRARTKRRLPVVMTVEEVRAVLYGGGLRLMEALRLRVQDVDFQRRQITVREGKGGKDRRTMLPSRVGEKLRLHLEGVRRMHRQDLAEGYGRVRLPHALASLPRRPLPSRKGWMVSNCTWARAARTSTGRVWAPSGVPWMKCSSWPMHASTSPGGGGTTLALPGLVPPIQF
ncbi:MAG: phage integrase N-terminal SAM-like domain-containing protein [Prochlorococcaceae cyanobacterium]